MIEESEQKAPAKRRAAGLTTSVLRRFVHLCTGLATVAIVLLIVVISGIYLRLSAGPINLTPYLPQIEQTISEHLPDARMTLASAEISLEGDDGGAVLIARDIALIDGESGVFARLPKAEGAFRIWDVILGRFLPSDVTLSGISARLVRDPSGAFRFGFGGLPDNAAGGEGSGAFNRLLAALAEQSDDSMQDEVAEEAVATLTGGQTLHLVDASIFYDDRVSRRTYRTTRAEVRIRTLKDGVAASADLSLDGGRHGEMVISLEGNRTETGDVSLAATFTNAAPRDLADQIAALDWMAAFDAPVAGRISLAMDAAGDLNALSGRFAGGAGNVRLGDGTEEPLTATSLTFDYAPADERFLIEDVTLEAARTSFRGAGFVEVNRDEAGEAEDIVAQLDFDGIRVSVPEFLDAPLDYRSGRFTGRVTLDPFMIEIGEMRLERTTMQIGTAGRIWQDGDDWLADVTATAGDFALSEMLAHWPRNAAPGALVWMRDNMETAHVLDADAVIRLGGDAEEVKIDFTFEDATGHYLRPMPPIRGGVGSGQVDLKRFSLGVDAGTVTPEGGAPIDLAGSTFVIEDLEHPDTPGTANIVARGAVADALALIDSEPLKLTSALGVPLGDVEGTAVIRATSTFPLLKDLLLEDVTADAKAEFADVALIAPGLEKRVSANALALDASTSKFTLAGDVSIEGLPLALVWEEVFSPSSRSISATGVATPKRLASFGIEQDWFTAGTIPIRATLSPGASQTTFNVTANLAPAMVSIPEIVWEKPEGEAGTFSAKGKLVGQQVTLETLKFDTPTLAFNGSAQTNKAGAPQRIDLDSLRFRKAIDLAMTVRQQGGVWRANARGPLLDLTGLRDITSGMREGESVSGSTPFTARLEVDRLRVTEDYFFDAVVGRVSRDEAGELTARFGAKVAGGADARLNFRRGPQGGEITLRTQDVGRLLRDAAVFDDGSSGSMALLADILPGDALALRGKISINDIVIHEDAKLEQLLIGADLSELRETMRDDGIVFSEIRAPFSFANDVLTLNEAVATGPSIGVNISGEYSLEEDTLDLDGVFTPLYALNSALGNIPLIGTVFTGGDGQGLFAFNFSVTGAAEDPNVRVNPLSVLTPGIFRRIFDIGEGSQKIDPNLTAPAESNER